MMTLVILAILLCFVATGGVPMKVPSFQTNTLMIVIAIVAINFAVFRAWYFARSDYWITRESFVRLELLVKGAVPMANVLVVGFLIGLRRHRSSPFLRGFLVFGAVALVLYVLALFLDAGPSIYDDTVTVFLLGWPQLAFALIGASLSRKSRNVVLQIVLALLLAFLIVFEFSALTGRGGG
jgi:hypothetical protein